MKARWYGVTNRYSTMPLNGRVSAKEVVELYKQRYKGEKLIRVQKDVPALGDVQGKHGWVVGGFQVHSEGDRAVVVVRRAKFISWLYVDADVLCVGWIG